MGYEKEAYLYLLFHYTGKKDFQEEWGTSNGCMFFVFRRGILIKTIVKFNYSKTDSGLVGWTTTGNHLSL